MVVRRRIKRRRNKKLYGAAKAAHLKKVRRLAGRKTRKAPLRRRTRRNPARKLYGAAKKAHEKRMRRVGKRPARKTRKTRKNPTTRKTIRVRVPAKRSRSGKIVRKAYSYSRKAKNRRSR